MDEVDVVEFVAAQLMRFIVPPCFLNIWLQVSLFENQPQQLMIVLFTEVEVVVLLLLHLLLHPLPPPAPLQPHLLCLLHSQLSR